MEKREEILGQRIRITRKSLGITLVKLSKKSGISQPYLSQLENGRGGTPSPDILRKLSDSLGLPYLNLMSVAGHYDELKSAVLPFPSYDLKYLLLFESEHNRIEFNGHVLSPEQCNGILTILGVLYPDYAATPKEGSPIELIYDKKE